MTEKSIFNTLWKIAFPAAIGLFFNTMLNIVDTYFAGLNSTLSLAAMSLSFPLFLFLIAVSEGLSTAASALISFHHGKNDIRQARKVGAQVLVYGVFSTLFLMCFGLFFSENVFLLLGATGFYLTEAREYMDTIFWGSCFFVFTSGINGILLARGEAKPLRNTLIVGFFLNCLLDPWFLYGGLGLPPMGLKGIALATVMVKALGLVYLIWILWHRYRLVDTNIGDYIPEKSEMKKIFSQQLPATLNTLTVALGLVVTNYFLKPFGQEAMAAYGAGLRVEQVFLLPTIGIHVALVSMVGFNFGAGNFVRMQKAIAWGLLLSLSVITVGAFILYFFPEFLLSIFTNDEAVVRLGSQYLRVAALTSFSYVLGGICVSILQGIRQPLFPIINGIFRQFIGRIFFIQWMLLLMGGSIEGIWWGSFWVNWVFSLLGIPYTIWRFQLLKTRRYSS